MNATPRPLALVTGASSGIGLEFAAECARNGFDLVIAADRPLDEAQNILVSLGAAVSSLQTDLATHSGVEQLVDRLSGRTINLLVANAGHGLGKSFLE